MGCRCDTRVYSAEEKKPAPDVLAKGLSQGRNCTNMTWIVVLVLYSALMLFVSIEAIRLANPWKFIYGTDSNRDVCGMRNRVSGNDLTSKPFLYQETSSCVTTCPLGYVVSRLQRCVRDATYFRNLSGAVESSERPVDSSHHIQQQHREQRQRRELRQMSPVSQDAIYRFSILPGKQGKQMEGLLESIVQNISLCRLELFYMCLIAVGCSVFIVLLLRFLTNLIVWFFLLTITALSIGSTIFLWLQYDLKQRRKEPSHLFYYGAISSTVGAAVYLLILFVLRKRIHLTATLFQEAGRALSSLPLLFLQPLWTLVVSIGFSALWLYSFMFVVAAAADVQRKREDEGYNHTLGQMVYTSSPSYDKHLANIFMCGPWLHLLGLLWWTRIFLACQHFIIAGSVASWYFSRYKNALGFPILRATSILVAYHLGSIILGSLLTSLMQLLRITLAVASKIAAHNRCSHCCTVCCSCCLAIFERFLKYINRNAYILISIHGYPFCEAAHEAFGLLSSNILRLSAINSVGDFILFLGKVAVVAASVIFGLEMQQAGEMQEMGVSYYWVPILLGAIFAWLIADYFLAVYEIRVFTMEPLNHIIWALL
ncbi:choline transporter-like protein 1 isoform X3 [Varroa destructor]|uniref:Choline transporter-like protein n=1 Tax=Varroa destructor TaxID=109461 RepID=A0A7M7KXJ7_VARDE|nr:choline transporter-like protein 1 isoform X3 [Varroa destructor]